MTNYLISGGTRLVGRHIINRLIENNSHQIYILSRHSHTSEHPQVSYINWNEENWKDSVPESIDVVINLAGATLNKRWTTEHKQLMMTSRIQATHALYELFKHRAHKPSVLFNASAMGYYPPSETAVYTEQFKTSPHDILSEIVYQWERQAQYFESLGTRVIYGRFGLILSKEGGALPMIAMPYKLMVGGIIGNGKQPYSWIHIDDLVRAILFLIDLPIARGPYNLTAPTPEKQNNFGRILGQTINRPHYTRVPGFIMRLALGEMSKLVFDTQYVLPERLTQEGFRFKHPTLKSALQQIYQS
ncbi:TIGR01777 family oxidoreductase [Staphylococcus canis]|uniref:TIGR01777 family protein n=1 Tax=Staphylococcus canis TaxID=2724942 RepID=A0ABS0T5Q8_9STAP|nr:TIGR01777 family oxidoreductase [Staphylococcus canis]MBI5974080.1 TIGR01777 family protein [Staphylococcus canis]